MSRRLSAFAARNNPIESEDEEEVIIKYQASSSSDSEDDDDAIPTLDLPLGDLGKPLVQTTTTTTTTTTNLHRQAGVKPITVSNFKPNDDNLIFDDSFVTIGLKQSEYLLIKGQYKIIIQRGCLKIDTVLYHASQVPIDIIAPAMISIPILYADQVIDRSLVSDERTEINEHLFSSDYKTVLKIENYFTGLEDISTIYPPLKNVFPNFEQEDEMIPRTKYEEAFKEYSFQPVFNDDGINSSVIGTLISKNWVRNIETITEEILRFNQDINNNNQLRLLIVGSKNSGKSTFLKKLLNHTLYKTDYCIPVNVMDLDPGQPEYSQPDSISISSITKEILGFNMSPLLDNKTSLLQKYVGYSNPNRQPQRYEQLCAELCDYYEQNLVHLNQPLFINTPGWIKGYGIELLNKLAAKIKPTHLIFLGPQNSNVDLESELMSNLQYDKLIPVHGFLSSISLRYSAAQLRNFKMLAYFHNTKNQIFQQRNGKFFNFQHLILSHSPYKVSFNDTDLLQFKGVTLVNVLNANNNLKQENIVECLEALVVGVYTMDLEIYQTLLLANKVTINKGLPNFIKEEINSMDLKYHGLSLVHSVDMAQKTINMYTPLNTSNLIKDGEVMILVRGRSEIPIEEIAPRALYQKKSDIPYITFAKNVGKGGKVLKIRRNIMRRSHH